MKKLITINKKVNFLKILLISSALVTSGAYVSEAFGAGAQVATAIPPAPPNLPGFIKEANHAAQKAPPALNLGGVANAHGSNVAETKIVINTNAPPPPPTPWNFDGGNKVLMPQVNNIDNANIEMILTNITLEFAKIRKNDFDQMQRHYIEKELNTIKEIRDQAIKKLNPSKVPFARTMNNKVIKKVDDTHTSNELITKINNIKNSLQLTDLKDTESVIKLTNKIFTSFNKENLSKIIESENLHDIKNLSTSLKNNLEEILSNTENYQVQIEDTTVNDLITASNASYSEYLSNLNRKSNSEDYRINLIEQNLNNSVQDLDNLYEKLIITSRSKLLLSTLKNNIDKITIFNNDLNKLTDEDFNNLKNDKNDPAETIGTFQSWNNNNQYKLIELGVFLRNDFINERKQVNKILTNTNKELKNILTILLNTTKISKEYFDITTDLIDKNYDQDFKVNLENIANRLDIDAKANMHLLINNRYQINNLLPAQPDPTKVKIPSLTLSKINEEKQLNLTQSENLSDSKIDERSIAQAMSSGTRFNEMLTTKLSTKINTLYKNDLLNLKYKEFLDLVNIDPKTNYLKEESNKELLKSLECLIHIDLLPNYVLNSDTEKSNEILKKIAEEYRKNYEVQKAGNLKKILIQYLDTKLNIVRSQELAETKTYIKTKIVHPINVTEDSELSKILVKRKVENDSLDKGKTEVVAAENHIIKKEDKVLKLPEMLQKLLNTSFSDGQIQIDNEIKLEYIQENNGQKMNGLELLDARNKRKEERTQLFNTTVNNKLETAFKIVTNRQVKAIISNYYKDTILSEHNVGLEKFISANDEQLNMLEKFIEDEANNFYKILSSNKTFNNEINTISEISLQAIYQSSKKESLLLDNSTIKMISDLTSPDSQIFEQAAQKSILLSTNSQNIAELDEDSSYLKQLYEEKIETISLDNLSQETYENLNNDIINDVLMTKIVVQELKDNKEQINQLEEIAEILYTNHLTEDKQKENEKNIIKLFLDQQSYGSISNNVNNNLDTSSSEYVDENINLKFEATDPSLISHNNIIENRLDNIGTFSFGDMATAAAAGDEDDSLIKKGVWVNGIYAIGKQEKIASRTPYSNSIFGISTGFDLALENDLLGVAYSYIKSKITYKNKHNNKYDINSNIFSLYGKKTLTSKIWFQGIASLGSNNVTGVNTRKVKIDEKLDMKNKSFNYNILGKINYSISAPNNFALIPYVGFKYGNNLISDYKETGSGAIKSIILSSNPVANSTGIFGINIMKHNIAFNNFHIIPKLHASVEYNFNNAVIHQLNVTADILGKMQHYQIATNKQSPYLFNIGGSLNIMSKQNIEASIDYNYSFDNQKYSAHQTGLKLQVKL